MKSQFFMDLIYTLREYKEGKFTKNDIMKLYQEWIDKGIISEKELIDLTGDNLYQFYSDVMSVTRNLRSVKVDKEEVTMSIDYIDTFEGDVMSKKTLASLTERSEQWVNIHKGKFVNNKQGVDVVSFLRWLKVYDFVSFGNFKKNYK